MAEATLKVSSDAGTTWNSLATIKNGSQLAGIKYQIILNGRKSLRMVFPVFTPDDVTSIAADKALITRANWDNINLETNLTDGITLNRTGLPPGVYDISINKDTITQFECWLELKTEVTTFSKSSNAECKLQYSAKVSGRTKWIDILPPVTVLVVEDIIPPAIVKFTADPIFILKNQTAKLKWEVANAHGIEIWNANSMLVDDTKPSGSYETSNLLANTVFTLKAKGSVVKDGIVTPPPRDIVVNVISKSDRASLANLFDNGKLTGLYEWDSKLYALVLHDKIQEQKNVLLWSSYDGLNWEKVTIYSKNPAFIPSGDRSSRAPGAIEVPLDFAGSPGIVMNDKLYLIGGSRFDTNFRRKEVYFLDLTNLEAGWQRDKDAGFSARMGHACVLHNKEIWVLGGYDDQGALNEVWKFDGINWTAVKSSPLPGDRCMLSAIEYNGKIQIFGGFGNDPGTADQTLADSYTLDGTWKKIEVYKSKEKTVKYVNCAVIELEKNRFIFSTVNEGEFKHRIQLITEGKEVVLTEIGVAGIGLSEYVFNLQAIAFKGVIWLCMLNKADTIQSNALTYFVYTP